MALDKIVIGSRVRKIREETFDETRKEFAQRCNLTERHIAQIERGEFLFSLKTLDKITVATGIDANFILYGNGKKNAKIPVKQNLYNIIETSNKDDLQLYYRVISTFRSYMNVKNKK